MWRSFCCWGDLIALTCWTAIRREFPAVSFTRGFRGKGSGNDCFTEMCSDSEAGSYLGLIDFVYHSTQGLTVIKKKKKKKRKFRGCRRGYGSGCRIQGLIEVKE